MGLQPLKTFVFWFSRMLFWFSFVLLVFPKVFVGVLKTFRKTKTTKKHISKGGSATFKHFVILFSRRFFWCSKNLQENQTNNKNKQTYPRVGLQPLKNVLIWCSRRFFGFSLVFFCIFGFPEGFCCFLKTFGKTNKNKTKPWVPFRSPKSHKKKHKVFEFWCVECSSLGPTAKISIHLSNSVWLVCVGFCMVLYKFNRLACTP